MMPIPPNRCGAKSKSKAKKTNTNTNTKTGRAITGPPRSILPARLCYIAAFTLSAVIGNERTRAPLASAIALAIAGATVVVPGSPQPVG